MKPSVIYTGEFVNIETNLDNENIQETITVVIGDTDVMIPDDESQTVIPLEMTGNPCRITVIDNSEDPFTTIRSKQCNIEIYTNNNLDISTFADGSNTRFTVTVTRTATVLFRGFLSIADLQQDFQPHPNVLAMTATDGLGYLNDINLVDFDGENPRNENEIMSYIAWCLAGTGQELPINVVMNVRHEDAVTLNADTDGSGHFYKFCFLDAKTFEKEINVSEDMYTVLDKILGFDCSLFQHEGEWWILRKDEIETRDFYVTRFDSEGNWVSNTTVVKESNVGVDDNQSFMNDDAIVKIELLYKQLELTYNYNKWLEAVCNIDFDRGTGPEESGTIEDETIDYELECWQFLKEGSGAEAGSLDLPPNAGSTGVLRKVFDFGFEDERFVVTDLNGSTPAGRHYFKSSAIPVVQGDRISIGVDSRVPTDGSIGNMFPVHVRLVANNGDVYDWELDQFQADPDDNINQWVLSSDALWASYMWRLLRTGEDATEWKNIQADSVDIPADGKIYIRLVNGFSDDQIDFANLTVEHIPNTNGSFRSWTGQQQSVTADATTKNIKTGEVFISDAPSPQYKGAILYRAVGNEIYNNTIIFSATDSMALGGNRTNEFAPGAQFYLNSPPYVGIITVVSSEYSFISGLTIIVFTGVTVGTVSQTGVISIVSFSLANRFYAADVFPDGPPDETYIHPFGYLQVFSVWNQINRNMTIIEGTVDHTVDFPDLVQKYFLTDPNLLTNDRIFSLLHTEIDLHLCEWTAYFQECFNTNIAKQYTGHGFKYLSE